MTIRNSKRGMRSERILLIANCQLPIANCRAVVRIAVVFVIMLALLPVYAMASYPRPVDDYVNDYAAILNSADHKTIRKMLSNLEYQTGIEFAVVTINSITDYPTGDSDIETFSKNLFNKWGVGHKKENNGVLMVVAVRDRMMRIQLGGGYGPVYDTVMKKVTENNIIPYFKEGNYSKGIYEGVRGVIENITKEVSWFSVYWPHILIGVLIIVCVFAGINFMKQGKKGWGFVFFAIAGILIVILLKMLASGKSKSGFGGGSSFGGGATGKW